METSRMLRKATMKIERRRFENTNEMNSLLMDKTDLDYEASMESIV
jgi:hypothetical protein